MKELFEKYGISLVKLAESMTFSKQLLHNKLTNSTRNKLSTEDKVKIRAYVLELRNDLNQWLADNP